jgi:hypothetical protein
MRSIIVCECLDGSCAGYTRHVGVCAAFIEVRDIFDETKRPEWYQVVGFDMTRRRVHRSADELIRIGLRHRVAFP